MTHKTADEIRLGLPTVLDAPRQEGTVRLVVRRPGTGQREILDSARLDVEQGLIGDDWLNRPASGTDAPSPYAQVTLMNARYAELIAGAEPGDWAQAGDQLYLDLDISMQNLPAGSRVRVGGAVIEISAEPHTGCALFSQRFGSDALRATNTERGRQLRLRGANAVVVEPGEVRPGDVVQRL
jgi:MOSC domain